MKIALIGNANSIHIIKFANKFVDCGNEVTLFSLFVHRDVACQLKAGVRVIYLEGRLPFAYYTCVGKLKKLLRRGKFDVVNAHYASGYGTLARLAKARPLVLNVWGSDVYEFPFTSKLNRFILRKNLFYADQLASTSYIMARHTATLLGGEIKEIAVTPFGIDTDFFKIKDNYSMSKGCVKLGLVKSLEINYGIEYLIKAMPAVIAHCYDKQHDVKLYIYGGGSDRERLELLVESLGVQNYVILEGEVLNSQLPDILKELDIFLQVSNQESFGVAAVEAMSVGLPVIATDTPGFMEVVENGRTGIIVERKNPTSIGDAIIRLIDNEEERISMGMKGRKLVEDKYSLDDNVQTLLEVYKKTMGRS